MAVPGANFGGKHVGSNGLISALPFLRQILATTIFQMQIYEISNGCKSNMSAHKGCRIEHSFGWKRNYRHT